MPSELASTNYAQSGDRHAFISYTDTVYRERKLLDDQSTIKGEIQWLEQMISLLTLTAVDPTTDTQIVTMAIILGDKKARASQIVSTLSST